ncbi:hypothetical protein ACQ3I4_10140 [Zafaria sp. Z1313]|uniref:hypothetical protein n=1 Tax=unclassified Zafaria TaxID=2828765 RepID=UPI003D3036DC
MATSTLLVIVEGSGLRDALRRGKTAAEGYLTGLPGVVEGGGTRLTAVSGAARIQARLALPRRLDDPSSAATAFGHVHALWKDGLWTTPGSCGPAPPDSNGATAWQWAHYAALASADPEAVLLLWEAYFDDLAGWAAA